MGEIIIRGGKPPAEKNPEEDLEWFCHSLGLLGKRDKDRTGLKIFKLFIKAAKENEKLCAEEISKYIKITRPAVIHHLKIMEKSGLITKEGSAFELRMRNLQSLVNEIEKDMIRTFDNIRKIAEDLDREFNMPVREKKRK